MCLSAFFLQSKSFPSEKIYEATLSKKIIPFGQGITRSGRNFVYPWVFQKLRHRAKLAEDYYINRHKFFLALAFPTKSFRFLKSFLAFPFFLHVLFSALDTKIVRSFSFYHRECLLSSKSGVLKRIAVLGDLLWWRYQRILVEWKYFCSWNRSDNVALCHRLITGVNSLCRVWQYFLGDLFYNIANLNANRSYSHTNYIEFF